MREAILAMMAVTAATPVTAQTCAPPPALAAWSKPVAAKSGIPLAIGTATTLALSSTPHFVLVPAKPANAGSLGLAIPFTVATAGTYRVAIGGPAWIDVVGAGKALVSSAHAHGEACSGIGKMVDFALAPGRYSLQLSGAKQPTMTVLVARLS